ncbi:MAG: phosphatase PAP2 family protein [Flavobacteriaceae bacterium]|nr:MAG: phosphatase PAP2 family protein [Flavobacteriaceae bacterium]
MEHLIDIDQQLFLYLNGLGCKSWDGFWLFVTEKKSWIPLYVLLLYFSVRSLGLKKGLLLLVLVLLGVLVSDQTTNFFKEYFQRLRPCFEPALSGLVRLVPESCGGEFGFCSGHASNHFVVAIFFGLLFKNRLFSLCMILWAATIAYSRIYLGVHYPLDVLMGSIIGISLGFLVYRLFLYFSKRFLEN